MLVTRSSTCVVAVTHLVAVVWYHSTCEYTYHATSAVILYCNRCLSTDGNEVLGGASVCREESSSPDQCSEGVILHACCTGVLGHCSLTTDSNCSFQDGYYHPNTVSRLFTIAPPPSSLSSTLLSLLHPPLSPPPSSLSSTLLSLLHVPSSLSSTLLSLLHPPLSLSVCLQ